MKRIIKITALVLAMITAFSSVAFALDYDQLYSGICPICGKACGYRFEQRTDAWCNEAAFYSVHCNTVNDFSWIYVGEPDPDRHYSLEYREGKRATCTESGYTEGAFCTTCNKWAGGHEYIAPLHPEGHDYECNKNCTASRVWYYCSICEDSYSVEQQPKSHTEGEWMVTKAPDCTSEGKAEQYCTECGLRVDSKILPANGHKWTDWAVIQQPTTTSCGQKIRTCTICKANETDIVPAGTQSRFIRSVSIDDVTVNYKSEMMLDPKIVSADGAKITLSYKSSAPDVVSVDSSGNIRALKAGSAVIEVSVTDADGFTVKDDCTVTVKYAWWQWLIRIVLLGFLWY